MGVETAIAAAALSYGAKKYSDHKEDKLKKSAEKEAKEAREEEARRVAEQEAKDKADYDAKMKQQYDEYVANNKKSRMNFTTDNGLTGDYSEENLSSWDENTGVLKKGKKYI